jgi:hypothetical protein
VGNIYKIPAGDSNGVTDFDDSMYKLIGIDNNDTVTVECLDGKRRGETISKGWHISECSNDIDITKIYNSKVMIALREI